MGTHGEGEMNENGDLFCGYCATSGLVVGETLFPHMNLISSHVHLLKA